MNIICLLLALVVLLGGCSKDIVKSYSPQPPVNISDHVDKQEDDSGDENPEARYVNVDIYAINDLHGRLADTDYQSGVDELSTYLKQAQQTKNTILLSFKSETIFSAILIIFIALL